MRREFQQESVTRQQQDIGVVPGHGGSFDGRSVQSQLHGGLFGGVHVSGRRADEDQDASRMRERSRVQTRESCDERGIMMDDLSDA